MTAAHAHAASGRAFQLARASAMPMRGNADAAREEIRRTCQAFL
jgi:hypothetical protein